MLARNQRAELTFCNSARNGRASILSRTMIKPLTTIALMAPALIISASHDTVVLADPAEQPPAAGAASKAGTPATVVDDKEAGGILGRSVRSSTGEDMGRVIDIIVSRSGQVRAAIIDFGGFLGVGSRKVAVAWGELRFPSVGQLDPVTVELTRDQVRLAPEYLQGEPIVVLGSTDAENKKAPPQNNSNSSDGRSRP